MNSHSPSTLRMRADRLHFLNFIVIFRSNSSSFSVQFFVSPVSVPFPTWRLYAPLSVWRAFDIDWLYSLHKQLDVDEIILKWCGQRFLFKKQTPEKVFLKNIPVRVDEALNILTSNITKLVNRLCHSSLIPIIRLGNKLYNPTHVGLLSSKDV